MKTVKIGKYTNYKHNAYDGYLCSYGVIMGLGGDGAFDAVDAPDCDCSEDELDYCNHRTPFGQQFDNGDLDIEVMLQNLDISDIEMITDGLNDWGEYEHVENYGNGHITCEFRKSESGKITVNVGFGDGHTFIVQEPIA
jgi:hypothetical protein